MENAGCTRYAVEHGFAKVRNIVADLRFDHDPPR
jgi:hypothetical protein